MQGPREIQATALKKIGWKSVNDVAEEESETVTKYVQDRVDKALR